MERKLTRKKAEHERMSVCVPGIQGKITACIKKHETEKMCLLEELR